MNKTLKLIALSAILSFTTVGCSQAKLQDNTLDTIQVATEYAELKQEFMALKIRWQNNSSKYSLNTRTNLTDSIHRVQLFYDTLSDVGKTRKVDKVYTAYIDAIAAVEVIKETLHQDKGTSDKVLKEIDKIHNQVKDFDSSVNRLIASLTTSGDSKKLERYKSLITMVIQAVKLLK